ncbi:MAG TPA: outer membrane lipid asymmetry maintenance protein MlaD [Candidatus Binataceae bacterium]|nr:outer membrane lipid asymmetry maintenance protein MlaD [Candidatus Binataceae bacterium]
MYASRTTKLLVGIFALLGILALADLSLRLGKLELFPPPSYMLYGNFDNITGLKVGDQVQIAGVKVGKVLDTSLQDYRARVAMQINDGIEVDSDAIAAIKTSGIIGDKYVAIALGGGDHNLADGGTIIHTQSAFVLEDAIGALINNSGSSGASGSSKGSDSGSGSSSDELSTPSSSGAKAKKSK